MESPRQVSYPLNSRVPVRIAARIPSGLLGYVDGTRAIIRNREIAWGSPLPCPNYVGKTYPAVVIGTNNPLYQDLELSLRLAERDPWEQVPDRFPNGAVIEGRIVGLIENAAFVEIEEAVEGYLHADELFSHCGRIGDLLWIDDHIKATVIGIDKARRHLTLSLKQLLERRAQDHQREKWKTTSSVSSDVPLGVLLASSVRHQLLEISRPTSATPPSTHRVLIIETDEVFGGGLQSVLGLNGCKPIWVQDAKAGLDEISRQNVPFDLILIGWGLPDLKGHELVRCLQAQGCTSHLVVFLEPTSMVTRPEILESLRNSVVDVLSKGDGEGCRLGILSILRELRNRNANAGRARPPLFPEAIVALAPLPAFVLEPRGQTPAKMQTSLLDGTLKRLKQTTQSTTVALLRLGNSSRRIEVQASVGKLFFSQEIPHDLVFSPLGDVLRSGRDVCERVAPDSVSFKRLLEIAPFEGFLGIPVLMCDSYQYGLALFRERGEFHRHDQKQARAAGYLIAQLIQERHLIQTLQPWQAQSLTGQMLGSVVHEVTNKLRGIQFQIEFLQKGLDELSRQPVRAEDFAFVSELEHAVKEISRAQQEADRLRERCLGMSGGDKPQLVDLERLTEEMLGLLSTEARHNNIVLEHRATEGIPYIRARSGELRQVLLNLILNAIQQMAQQKRYGKVVVKISASGDLSVPVQLRCTDDGPGIHNQLWERIFDFGVTNKTGGAGIGLTISRQIAANLGGNLRVEQSHMFWGTTFLLELPKGE